MISRRLFLALTGTAVVLPPAWASEQSPQMLDRIMLDYIILGCNDLDAGIAFVEDHTGVRAAGGGVHPGRGTANALLSANAITLKSWAWLKGNQHSDHWRSRR